MAADLFAIAITAVVTQFLTPTAKHIGEVALERARQVGDKAAGYLIAIGRATWPVEDKLLLPLLQAAILESDTNLVDVWAAMLANAGDPTQRAQVRVSFIETLRQFTLNEVLILDAIAKAYHQESASSEETNNYVETASVKRTISDSMSEEEFAIAIDILIQLRLCQVAPMLPGRKGGSITLASSIHLMEPTKYISLTALGQAFLRACTPPTA